MSASNNQWGSDVEIISTGYSLENDKIGCQCYLLREITLVILTVVYIPPHANTNQSLDELYGVINRARVMCVSGQQHRHIHRHSDWLLWQMHR